MEASFEEKGTVMEFAGQEREWIEDGGCLDLEVYVKNLIGDTNERIGKSNEGQDAKMIAFARAVQGRLRDDFRHVARRRASSW